MATPIKDTPVLYGEDARRFEEAMREAKNNKVAPEEAAQIRAAFESTRIFNSMAEYEQFRAAGRG